jgi:hypothetical protein
MAMKLKERIEQQEAAQAPRPRLKAIAKEDNPAVAKARQGKIATVGHFSPELHMAIKMLGLQLGNRSVQSMMGEAWDLFLVKNGQKPFHEYEDA